MIFLAKRFLFASSFSFILFTAGLFGSCSEFGLSLFENPIAYADGEVIDSDDLTPEEQTVYNQLGPVYQGIYLHALSAEMRHRVVIYVCRGLTPFEAINVILRAEQRKFESRKHKRTLTPGERAALYKRRKLQEKTTGHLPPLQHAPFQDGIAEEEKM